MGCEGGSPDLTLIWFVEEQKQFAMQIDYPYLGLDDYCKENLITYNEYVATKAYRLANES